MAPGIGRRLAIVVAAIAAVVLPYVLYFQPHYAALAVANAKNCVATSTLSLDVCSSIYSQGFYHVWGRGILTEVLIYGVIAIVLMVAFLLVALGFWLVTGQDLLKRVH